MLARYRRGLLASWPPGLPTVGGEGACVMILLCDMPLAHASLWQTSQPLVARRLNLIRPIPICWHSAFGAPLALHLQQTGNAMRVRMRMRAARSGRACGTECEKCADSVTPILGWGFLIPNFLFFSFLDGSAVCIKYKAPVHPAAWGMGSTVGLLDTTPFPFISTRYSARSHLVDGIGPPHNPEGATSFPRVTRGPSRAAYATPAHT